MFLAGILEVPAFLFTQAGLVTYLGSGPLHFYGPPVISLLHGRAGWVGSYNSYKVWQTIAPTTAGQPIWAPSKGLQIDTRTVASSRE